MLRRRPGRPRTVTPAGPAWPQRDRRLHPQARAALHPLWLQRSAPPPLALRRFPTRATPRGPPRTRRGVARRRGPLSGSSPRVLPPARARGVTPRRLAAGESPILSIGLGG